MIRVEHGDSRDVLPTLEADSIHACVCDPPYSLVSIVKRFGKEGAAPAQFGTDGRYARASAGFMGKAWDTGETAFDPAFWSEVMRVLKPGAFLLAMGGDRTFHRLAVAIEDAGFEIRGTLAYIYGSGFPKSRDITRDLLSLPACGCGVSEVGGDLGGIIKASGPAGSDGTAIGAELRAVDLACVSAEQTAGLRFEPGAEAQRRQPAMQAGIEHAIGHLDPVMLRPLDVTATAERCEVAGNVGGVEFDPESLRDEMMGNEPLRRAAVEAAPVTLDDAGGQGGPRSALVPPLFASPCGVARPGKPIGVVDTHAAAGAIGAGTTAEQVGGLEVAGTGATSEKGHKFQCKHCGGVKQASIPKGLGTALKPAMELICMARKPLGEKTVASNVLRFGTGALNIDGCRVSTDGEVIVPNVRDPRQSHEGWVRPWMDDQDRVRDGQMAADERMQALGRWPANIIHDGSEEVVAAFPETQSGALNAGHKRGNGVTSWDGGGGVIERDYGNDSGSAARFFKSCGWTEDDRRLWYGSKADHDDRLGSKHPTVKPVDLMAYLCRLVTPPGGTVLDPFAGSGTTGMACMKEGFDCILIEREAEYHADILRRLKHVKGEDAPLFAGLSA